MEREKKMVLEKRIASFIIGMLLFSVLGNLVLMESCSAAGNTIYVDQSNTQGPWDGSSEHPYKNISRGVAAASSGDTIYVRSGTYYENVLIEKSISLIGSYTTSKPIVHGQHAYKSTIEIMSNEVTVSGFDIHNTIGKSADYSGFAIGKTHYTQGDFTSVTISNCNITDAYQGILMKGTFHNISSCEINDNTAYGIFVISGGDDNLFSNNVIDNNPEGINLQRFCNNNEIRDNTITNSRVYGIEIASNCSNNSIYYNHFIQNYKSSCDNGINAWDNGYPSGGNYWDNYTGMDQFSGLDQNEPGSDLIGDIPYAITGGQNKDNYPLGYFKEPEQPGGQNQPPTAYIHSMSPNPARAGETVSFRGSGVDIDGNIVYYEWRSSRDDGLSEQASFSTTRLSVGEHTIYFRVQDDSGAWSTEKTDILIITPSTNNALIAYIDEITPNPATAGEMISFRGHGTAEEGSTITSYRWSSDRDGVLSTQSSFNTSALSLGTHIISFRVKDNNEISSEPTTYNLTIEQEGAGHSNQPPTAEIEGLYQGEINKELTFDGSGSHDNDGSITVYQWDFGDETLGTGVSPTHTYTTSGTYTVSLQIIDDDGAIGTASMSVSIGQSTSQGDNLGSFSIFDIEIPFPLIILVVFLIVLGVITYFIMSLRRR